MVTARIWPLSTPTALVGLGVLAFGSAVFHAYLALRVNGPVVFMDELVYERMAASLAHTGHFSVLGKGGFVLSPLYPVAIAPIYLATSSAQTAYEAAKVVNATLLALSVFPLYAAARFLLSPGRAFSVAAGSLILPLMFYADFQMSESLAYPLFLVTIWMMLRTVRDGGLANDALLLGSMLCAAAARLQNIALVPAALTAVALVPLLAPPDGQRRLRALATAVGRHWLLFGSCGLAGVSAAINRAINGGSLPFAGGYSRVGATHASALRMLELSFQHLAELDFALGVVPFAVAVLAAYLAVRLRLPGRALVFGSVALAVTFWFLVEVAYFAATVDVGGGLDTAPRIHERYLVYLMPLFLTAFAAGLGALRLRPPALACVVITAVAALLPAAIPFNRVINGSIPVDSFALQMFAVSVHGQTRAASYAVGAAIVLGVCSALLFLYSALRRRPAAAVATTVASLLTMSGLVLVVHLNTHLAGETPEIASAHTSWVDAAAKGESVTVIAGGQEERTRLLLAVFRNLSVSRLYSTCSDSFDSVPGGRRVEPNRDGVLVDGPKPIHAAYVLADMRLGIRGRVVASQPEQALELLAPTGGIVRVRRPLRCSA